MIKVDSLPEILYEEDGVTRGETRASEIDDSYIYQPFHTSTYHVYQPLYI